MTFHRDLALGPLVAIVPRRCSPSALSLLLGLEGESRSEPGLGRPPGGIDTVGAGKQSNQDCEQPTRIATSHAIRTIKRPFEGVNVTRDYTGACRRVIPPRSVPNTPAPERERRPRSSRSDAD